MTYPFIVLEGPDSAGKTTLGKALVDYLGAHYIHLTYRFKDKMFDYHTAALEQCLRHLEHGPVVLDRWWGSELIYAQAFRGGSQWPMGGRLLDRAGLKHSVFYVLCRPESRDDYVEHHMNVKETRYKAKGHALAGREGMVDDQAKVYDLYGDWHTWLGPRDDVFVYDWMTMGDNLQDVCQAVTELSYDRLAYHPQSWHSRGDRRFAGSPDARWLLVGHQSKLKTRRQVWPFFEHGNSSLWVTKTLEALNVSEDQLAWCNAYDETGKLQITRDDLEALDESVEVVALGNEAAKALDQVNFDEFHYLKHPQWYRRFSHSDTSDWKELFNPQTLDLFHGEANRQRKSERENAACNLGLA